MKLTDIIALAKMGYTPNDIKELTKEVDDNQTHDQEPIDQHEEPEEQPKESEQPMPEKEADIEQKEDAGADDIEVLKNQIKDLQEQLNKAQKSNTNKNLGSQETKSNEDLFGEVMRGFM